MSEVKKPEFVVLSIMLNLIENKPEILLLDIERNIEVVVDTKEMILMGISVGLEDAWIAGYVSGYSDRQHSLGMSIPKSLVTAQFHKDFDKKSKVAQD